MPTATRPPAASAANAAVSNALAAAAGRVRANDLLTGGAAAAVLALGYLTAMIVLDKLFALPDWARQLGLLAFVGGLAAVAYFLVVRPYRRRVNPRYIARQIEATLPNSKNVLINWVDLQDEHLPGSVKAAVGANAAEGMADADVEGATKSRRVVALGVAAGLLVAVLATLALVFSVPQFLSLFQRAFVPFAAPAIATETTINVTAPDGGNATLTDGQPLTVAVALDGRTPDPNGPKKVRLLVRYSQESDDAVELPLTAVGTSGREYRLDLSRGTILNGFWYRVAAGDGLTPEYRVTVRTRPLLADFGAKYDYPAYLKWPAAASDGSTLRAIKGTTVTLSVTANRAVEHATLVVYGEKEDRRVVPGVVGGAGKDRLTFTLPLKESGTYRIDFKPAGEPQASSADYPVEVYADAEPQVKITAPKEDVIQLPLNGLLAVDGTITDDHGIAGVVLHVKREGSDADFKAKVFRDGKPLVREQDGTHLTDIPDYKDSIKLDTLTDAAGKPVVLREKDVLEYWLTATDNCEPDANVGKSKVKKVTLLPAVKEPEKKQQEDKRHQDRKADEQKADGKRDEQLKNEQRPADQGRDPDTNKKPDQPQGKPENGDKKPEGQQDPKEKPGDPPQQGDGKSEEQKRQEENERKAEQLKKDIDKKKQEEKGDGGGARGDNQPDGGTDKPPPAEPKPNDPKQEGGEKGAAGGKSDPKDDPNAKPEDKQGGTGKDEGKNVDAQRSDSKADPKSDPDKANPKNEPNPDRGEGKAGPKDGAKQPGESKPSKETEQPKPDPTKPPEQQPKNDGQAGEARGAEGSQPQQPGTDKKDPPKGDAKPKGDPQRGERKESPKPEEGNGDPKGDNKSEGGTAKGSGPPKAENKGDGSKPDEKKGPPPGAAGGKEDPKENTGAGEAKGEGKKPEPGTDPKGGQPGEAKPSPQPGDKPKDPQGGTGEGKPLDPKEAEQAMKDLQSKDPATKKAAQDKLDKAVGKENREKAEQLQKDAQSDDKGTREKAEKELEKMKEQAQKGGADGQKGEKRDLSEKEKAELKQAAEDLTSKDAAKRDAAEKKIDEAVGEQKRKELQQDLKDLQGDDPKKAEAAQKKIEKAVEQAKKEQGTPGPGGLSDQQKKDAADAAKDLTNPDDAKRQAAEKKVDEAVGKEKREEVQKQMQQARDGDNPQKQEEARKKLEKALNEAKGQGKPKDDRELGGAGSPRLGDPIQATLEDQLKSRELALDDFKKYRGNKEFLKDSGMTDEQYEQFVRDYQKATDKFRDDVDARRLNPTAPVTKPGIRNDAGGDRLKTEREGSKLNGNGGGAKPPPGFEDALRRFNTEASKQEKK